MRLATPRTRAGAWTSHLFRRQSIHRLHLRPGLRRVNPVSRPSAVLKIRHSRPSHPAGRHPWSGVDAVQERRAPRVRDHHPASGRPDVRELQDDPGDERRAAPDQRATAKLGISVLLEVWPSGFTWHHGDGSSRPAPSPAPCGPRAPTSTRPTSSRTSTPRGSTTRRSAWTRPGRPSSRGRATRTGARSTARSPRSGPAVPLDVLEATPQLVTDRRTDGNCVDLVSAGDTRATRSESRARPAARCGSDAHSASSPHLSATPNTQPEANAARGGPRKWPAPRLPRPASRGRVGWRRLWWVSRC